MVAADNKRDQKNKPNEGGMAAKHSKTGFDPLRDNDANNIFQILDPIKESEQKSPKSPKQQE